MVSVASSIFRGRKNLAILGPRSGRETTKGVQDLLAEGAELSRPGCLAWVQVTFFGNRWPGIFDGREPNRLVEPLWLLGP